MPYEHQDWEPVTIRSSEIAKKYKQTVQNAAGTKEFKSLVNDELPKLDKITTEQSKILREARSGKGLTQYDLAKRLNINVSIIKDYENGTVTKFNKKTYNTILRTLGVSCQ